MRDKQGLFEVADGGTFFLDELGEMSPALQVKLLRVLQDGTFMPVGGTKQKHVDVRVVAATNRNLEEMVKKGTFREDLYYRLNVVSVRLPPLRERAGDVPLLVQFFLSKIAAKSKQGAKTITPDAMACLERYQWPGNIRQLENEMLRACVMSGKETVITREHLSPTVAGVEIPLTRVLADQERALKEVLDQVEREMIEQAIGRCEGNKSEAARQLGIARSNLIAKCREYGLE
jgi:transcriptional regulator with PAS, ATPase and Fis domain